ncbi:cysteine hydrolase [Deltaproteobacteria bacterium Smac51]|nr:cysteine hydrolase [Deltaproteobacteria bacterium Smac51]
MASILLIVDMQTTLINDNPYGKETLITNISQLIAAARKKGVEIGHVQHDGGKGDELEKGTAGWEICPALAPSPGEMVLEKHLNSAFKNTAMHDYLQSREIKTIILAGMQTEYCIDATCRSAFDLGYSVIIPQGSTSTFDNEYMTGEKTIAYYEKKIWNNRFASVPPVSAVIEAWAVG